MNNGQSFNRRELLTEYLAKVNHGIKIVRNIVIWPVFKVKVSYRALIILLQIEKSCKYTLISKTRLHALVSIN